MSFRITWDGYYDVVAETEEEAAQAFITYIEDEDTDYYGRDRKELIKAEELEDNNV